MHGLVTRRRFNAVMGTGFAAATAGTAWADDYIATYVYDPATRGSTLALLHAERIEDAPVAVIQMPQRVPQGLHGNWIAGA
jgi:carotenoid cleavage dioxygenase